MEKAVLCDRAKRFVPIIAITCRSLQELPEHPDLYRGAVEKAGGSSDFISPKTDARKIARSCAGVVIPGGRDPDPALYGEKEVFDLEIETPVRINFEMLLLREIIGLRKPVLGICYGMQLINIFFGGCLYQDISAQRTESLNHKEGMHPIRMGNNPYMDGGELLVNSSHHEAVKEAGRGIIPFGYAPDGLIEAFYLEGYGFLLGVQWHPERMQSAMSRSLFERFVEACRGQ